ncbi:MAG: porin, partial [Bacteroidota bacterium]|nr:porin [Bacteroidota bacterium]MDX5430591.1 porin [Bacteroidota bacterium]MDX5469343.1 porin [Bacteroidota bacterium]
EVKWTPTAKVTFAWNTYAGSERVANTLRRRYFNNLYWKQDLGSKWKLILGLDAGIQETADKQAWDDWWNTTLIVQYIGHKKYRFAYRAEYFQDSANVVSIDQFPSFMMEAFGTSLNMDYLIHDKAMLRGEYRYLHRLNKASANPDSHLFTLSICMNFLK